MRFQNFSASATLATLFAFVPLISALAINKQQIELSTAGHVLDTGLDVSAAVGYDLQAQAGQWWVEGVRHQGMAAFNPNPTGYKVWRNVKDYGAKGDGVTDDTEAINAAIRDGSRCGKGCDSSTTTPALVYFPSGTYVVSRPIIAMYYSQLVGDFKNRPVIKGAPNFAGMALLDSDPYDDQGNNWYTNQNNFFRAIRNFVIDTTNMPPQAGTGIHWQVAQATSLVNIHFEMSQAAGNKHQGIFMDNGSGGFMSDLTFTGGAFGMWIGNQQFMTRNLKFKNCKTAIYLNWDWQWTFKSVSIDGSDIGLDITSSNGQGGQSVGSAILLDSEIKNTKIGVRTSRTANSVPLTGGSAILDNVKLVNVNTAVANENGGAILAGGTTTIDLWAQGHSYTTGGARQVIQGPVTRKVQKPKALLDATGKIFEKTRPQYGDIPASNFISVKSEGAKGDGKTDDTAALKAIFQKHGGNLNKVIFFDHGHYVVTDTILIPVNTRVVGEVWSTIMAGGNSRFKDPNNPVPVIKVGNDGDEGLVELSELLLETKGPQPGAILLQWNSRDRAGQQGENGMWDVHIRVAGSAGTELEVAQCKFDPQSTDTIPDPKCQVAFMLMHITENASVYIENCWAWTSDHALDIRFDKITVYNARGILDQSRGPVWMYATAAEHNTLYQFQIDGAKNLFMGMIQTETPYFQSNPPATVPFPPLAAWNDPTYENCTTDLCRKSWALRILNSQDILLYGAGLYSFFENYSQDCVEPQTCQDSVFEIRSSSNVGVYQLNTVASKSLIEYEGRRMAPAGENTNAFARTVVKFEI